METGSALDWRRVYLSREVAGALEISPNAVKGRIDRGRLVAWDLDTLGWVVDADQVDLELEASDLAAAAANCRVPSRSLTPICVQVARLPGMAPTKSLPGTPAEAPFGAASVEAQFARADVAAAERRAVGATDGQIEVLNKALSATEARAVRAELQVASAGRAIQELGAALSASPGLQTG